MKVGERIDWAEADHRVHMIDADPRRFRPQALKTLLLETGAGTLKENDHSTAQRPQRSGLPVPRWR